MTEELFAPPAMQTEQKKKHVIERFLEAREAGTGPHTMIIGHRGGFIGGPENSMSCFRGAQANNIDGIEFDVWLTRDNVPVITHGGDNGELHHSINGVQDRYVFDTSHEELKAHVDIGDGETIPTLEQLLQELAGSEMLLNIELKAPIDTNIANRYNHRLAARLVCDLISKYRVAHLTMISSFSDEVIGAVNVAAQGRRDFVIQSLRNFDLGPDPADYAIDHGTQNGVNIVYSQLTRPLIQRIKQPSESAPLVGVWYFAGESSENQAMYSRVFNTCGPIDFFYSDKPLEAKQARDMIEEAIQQ